MNKKQKGILSLKEYEWTYLNMLLEHGYPVSHALKQLLDCNHPVFQKLDQGTPFIELIHPRQGKFYQHLHFFLNIASVSDAISYSLQMKEFEGQFIKKLYKKLAYPLFILLFAFGTLFFFTSLILPQMMINFTVENQTLIIMIHFMEIFIYFVLSTAILIFLLLIFMFYHNKFRYFFLRKVHSISILKQYTSYQLSGYLIVLSKKGIATIHTLLFLEQLNGNYLLKQCVNVIHNKLKQGYSFEDCILENTYLCDLFKQNFKVGKQIDHVEQLYSIYMNQQEQKWDLSLKRITSFIQLFAYVFVGIMVIVVYQIMLIPLSMLQTM